MPPLTSRELAGAQAAYYLPTALAPILSRRRFEAVTGPKSEWWLVVTVATLVGSVGVTLASAARRDACTPEIALLGVGSAAGLGAVDVVYVLQRRIAPVYLVDAAVQLGLAAGWLRVWRARA